MTSNGARLPDWRELVRLSDPELARFDIAAVNLACAAGLPGAERIDAARCLKCLDDWAGGVREITQWAVETEFRPNVERYDGSEPLFRMVKLVHVLQRRCGVLYNPAKIAPAPSDPIEAEDEFIHGAIQGPGGTCASLPVVYTAVARRIGYPVFVVWAKGHAFCRWDDPKTGTRANIEGTSHDGVNTHSDDHYRNWPEPFGAREEELFGYLRSLSPREELASFLEGRSLVWEGAGDGLQAVDALAAAVELDAHPHPRYAARLVRLVRRWGERLRGQGRIGHSFRYPLEPVEPRRWPNMPWEWEAEILALDAAERGRVPSWALSRDSSQRAPNVRL